MPTLAEKLPKKIFARAHEITADYYRAVDKHLDDIVSGAETEMFEIRDLAEQLHIHPTHLSNTIRLTTGKAPCYYFEMRIMDIARERLRNSTESVANIAKALTFDPSNFTKFFKRFEGKTPNQYRQQFVDQTDLTQKILK
ncbi:AraC family transcriptional regulator [Mucilaginibacter sp. RS28]|uniref:AraC family transcriptional regulator n=1 Tax=Mucilaginibacter straminoryzae TaxID=2932774 RepID=A0A9X1X071_9SPHI|nr:AraC family transcriptional regulator [Mucilaginibacter straminoryzae]MCJ8208749.1 AraC family transcriptional regulator [Mucilaginibacter straminoryzae]